MNENTYYKSCSKCGRPQTFCKGECCGKPQGCCCREYGPKVCGCIRQIAPKCPYEAVIPSITVDTVENIKNLADCFVHVAGINTTFYIDDKHRIITTWAGPVEYDNYDLAANPLGLRSQFLIDFANDRGAYYDKTGAYEVFSFGNGGSPSRQPYEIIVPDNVPTGTYDYDYDGGMGALVLALGREWERPSIVIKDDNGNVLTPEDIEALGAENLDITFALSVPAMEDVSASSQTWNVPAFLGYFKIDSFAPAATDGGTWSMRGRCYDAGDAPYLIDIRNYEEDDTQSFSASLYIPNAMVVLPS